MRLRFSIFGLACASIFFGGFAWIVTDQPETKALPANHPRQRVRADLRRAATTAVGEVGGSSVVMTPAPVGEPLLREINDLLGKQRWLAPTDRGAEDEIRCALEASLTNENAAAMVKALPPENQRCEFGVTALARWAATDALGASLWLAQQAVRSDGQTWAVAQALVKDPVVLEVLDERLPADSWREALLEDASRAALPVNPGDAVALAQRLQPGEARTKALLRVADEWSLRDPAAALRWIASEPDVSLRDELLFTAATAQASTDPVAALEWTPLVTSDATMERAISKIAAMWADYAPERAQRFVAKDPASGNRPSGLGASLPP